MNSLRKLIIDWGDLAGLTAIAVEPRPDNVVIWHPVGDDSAAGRRREAALEHATVFAAEEFTETGISTLAFPPGLTPEVEPQDGGLGDATLLTMAARFAIESGCTTIVWPQHVRRDFESMTRAVEQSILVASLAELSRSEAPLRIETPFIDLSDTQLLELASRSGAPLRSAWWCKHDRPDPCGGCSCCLRWFDAADEAGVALPWTFGQEGENEREHESAMRSAG